MSTLRETGEQIMKELNDPGYLEKRAEDRNDFNDVLQDYAAEVCFGRVWSRPALDRKQRSLLNIAMLVALNRPDQLRVHVRGALNHGCTVEELKEVLLHTAVYCGLPAAAGGFKVAEEELVARGLLR